MTDIEQVGNALLLGGIGYEAVHAPAVVEILPHVEMRKQPCILEHIADPPTMRRDMNTRSRVIERLVVECDNATIRPQQACNHVDQRGLAGAGSAEQPGDAALAFE